MSAAPGAPPPPVSLIPRPQLVLRDREGAPTDMPSTISHHHHLFVRRRRLRRLEVSQQNCS